MSFGVTNVAPIGRLTAPLSGGAAAPAFRTMPRSRPPMVGPMYEPARPFADPIFPPLQLRGVRPERAMTAVGRKAATTRDGLAFRDKLQKHLNRLGRNGAHCIDHSVAGVRAGEIGAMRKLDDCVHAAISSLVGSLEEMAEQDDLEASPAPAHQATRSAASPIASVDEASTGQPWAEEKLQALERSFLLFDAAFARKALLDRVPDDRRGSVDDTVQFVLNDPDALQAWTQQLEKDLGEQKKIALQRLEQDVSANPNWTPLQRATVEVAIEARQERLTGCDAFVRQELENAAADAVRRWREQRLDVTLFQLSDPQECRTEIEGALPFVDRY